MKLLSLALLITLSASWLSAADCSCPVGGRSGKGVVSTAPIVDERPIYRHNAFDIESGMLWEVGHYTSIDYRLVPTEFVWRTPRWFGYNFDSGATISLRNRFALIGTWVAKGPEHQYIGFSASPSIEYWNKDCTWSVYAGSGGGAGVIDSQGVEGGQGQDFTLNWFAQLGVEHVLTNTLSIRAGGMFQHMSNGGATSPNPGIDAIGFTLGASWKF